MSQFAFTAVDKISHSSDLIDYLSKFESLSQVQQYRENNLNLMHMQQSDQVLEIGCGTGSYAAMIAHNTQNGFVTAIDSSLKMLTYAKQQFSKSNLPLLFVHGNALQLPYTANKFDKCYCERVLQHIENPIKALREFHRALAPQSLLVCIEPDWETLTVNVGDKKLTDKILKHQCNYITNAFVARNLERYLIKIGFSINNWIEYQICFDDLYLADYFYKLTLTSERAVSDKLISKNEQQDWLNEIHTLAAERKFFSSISLLAVIAQK